MRARLVFCLAAGLVAAALGAPELASGAPLHFAPPIFVDQNLAGGEPFVVDDPVHHTLLYTSHEGTTHLYQPGLVSISTLPFLTNYRDQVNMWTSRNDGQSWQQVNYQSTGFATNPANNVGFSDPDLTFDGGGRVYNTGIDLANDAVFSSPDGGKTWDKGTPECHDGDRPWLAGGKKDEVFLATNEQEPGGTHAIFDSTDGGNTCPPSGIPDKGTTAAQVPYQGDGKLYYVRDRDMLVEPICFNGCSNGVGISTWHRGDAAFKPANAAYGGPIIAHWPAIALDSGDTIYEVWDTDLRRNDKQGCADTQPTGNGASGSPLPNQIQYAYTKDFGQTWSAPITVTSPPGSRVFWPWVAAGDAGKISIVWYQTDKVVDLDCQVSKISVQDANILNADTPNPTIETVDVAGRPIHDDGVCQGGTTCVATGQDRRLGDFFTNNIDSRGCVMIASGDTTKPDPGTGGPRPLSLPIFLRQDSGPALVGGGDCSGESASLGLPASNAAITNAPSTTPSCASRRAFRIRLRAPKGERLRSATLFVAGKRVTIRARGRTFSTLRGSLLRAPVNLRGLPRGSFTVRVEAVTTTGKHLVDLRRYRTCTPKHKTKPKRHPLKPKKKG